MSRRTANPAADRAAQNQQTIKSLLKLEGNKSCADCKRNKHPRWASWNLGIFVCIRCSGIHRGMGTHISRVKSVDLDAWTDEQLQSVLKWGNARANKYWESKLAPGHVPSEAKIENFIRTKYESKRWVLEGPIPDPSTLDTEGDDDVPLNIVQEKAKLDRSSSQRNASSSSQPAVAVVKPKPNVNLFDDDDDIPIPPARPNTTESQGVRPPPAKPISHSQLLGGLDFLSEPPDRPASASSKPQSSAVPSRPDLKQSILSLYATAPRPQSQSSTPLPHVRQSSFGGMQSQPAQQSSAFGGLDDAFAGLQFSTPTSTPAARAQERPNVSPFASLNQTSSQRSAPAPPQVTSNPLSGGGFFDTSSKPPPKSTSFTKSTPVPPHALRKISNASSGFGEFSSALNPTSASSIGTSTNGLLDLSSPQSLNSAKPANPVANPSVFNLSAPKPSSQYQQVVQSSAPAPQSTFSNFSTADPWGSHDPWASVEPAAETLPDKSKKTATVASAATGDFGWGNSTSTNNGLFGTNKSPVPSSTTTSDFGWGNSSPTSLAPGGYNGNGFNMSSLAKGFGTETPSAQPTITADEDFGGWNSAASETPAAAPAPSVAKTSSQAGKQPGGFASDDLWSNVWQ